MMSPEFAAAIPVPYAHPAVAARISRSGNELWLGIPCELHPYVPPGGAAAATVTVFNRPRRVHNWSNPSANVYQNGFEAWKRLFFQTINTFWDRKIRLVPSYMAGSGAAAISGLHPEVVCRFHAYEVPSGGNFRGLVFLAMTRDQHATQPNLQTGQLTSACMFLGRRITSGIPQGYTAVLDSNDMRARDFTIPIAGGGTVSTSQVAACHEVGHYIGLNHRCAVAPPGAAGTRSFFNPNAASERDPGAPASTVANSNDAPAYCMNGVNAQAVRDIMAYGSDVSPWHAALWLDILQSVNHNGVAYNSTTWVARVS